ncbi:MAG: rhomboid family intramembrane serine protease [Candidatus Binataceae bacterium]|nr:rhomboid family intramembrane serine protease [Candidatus Binataceae bacterium]
MIPLRDSEATRRLTPINSLLIAANLAVFVLEARDGRAAGAIVARYAMVPARVAQIGAMPAAAALRACATIVTSMFLHAGLLHLAGNMLYLLIFGPAVENRLGAPRYAIFYLAAGVAAGLAMVAMGPASRVAVIGASGAIAGVLGAYFVLYPRARITVILPLIIFFSTVQIPALFFLLAWFAVQLYAGIAAGAAGPMVGGVAWWAHVGGFLFGVAIAPILAGARPTPARRPRRA